jgi:FixJ family two-component response regulator
MPLISVVDDDLSVCRALRRLIQSAGYKVETFVSAREFLNSSPEGRTACLVLDIHLAEMSGFELQERLAADQAAIPIIFITAYDDASIRDRITRSGVTAYLRKPFDERVLLDAIRAVVVGQADGRGAGDGDRDTPRSAGAKRGPFPST